MSDWFGTVTADVAFDPTLSTTAKAVYLVLVMYRNRDTDTCFPSNSRIASGIGASERTVIRGVQELVEAGIITRQPRYVDGRQTTSLTHLTDAHAHRGYIRDTHVGVTDDTQNRPTRNTKSPTS